MSIETMGGYRLVRKLGEGPRADVLLGYPSRAGSAAAPAAIKVYRPSVSGESIMTEIEALSRAAGPHSVALIDLASSSEGTSALILERLGGGSVAKLVAERSRLRTGEAITILGPLATTLMRIHEAGVAHGGLAAERVLFDSDGSPVLVGFGSAQLLPPGLPTAMLSANEAVTADYAAFARLARSVFTLVRDERAHELGEWLLAAPTDDRWIDAATRRIYELGDASAVDLAVAGNDVTAALPARALTAPPAVDPARRSRVLDMVGAPDWMQDVLRGPLERVVPLARSVRPRVWIAAAAVVVALACAAVLVPSSDSDATAEPPAPATSHTEVPSGPVTGEDPIAALLVLWEERERCIRDLSVLCLDAVDQANSSALAEDQQLIRSLQAGAESSPVTVLDSSRLSVTESLGDTVIIGIELPADGEPASVLMMRSEAGWRIRDYLE